MVSQYEYTAIMNQLKYNYETGEWELPSRCFKEFEADQTLFFSSRYSAHEFIYNMLLKGN